jgi:hypothetical protein
MELRDESSVLTCMLQGSVLQGKTCRWSPSQGRGFRPCIQAHYSCYRGQCCRGRPVDGPPHRAGDSGSKHRLIIHVTGVSVAGEDL